MFKKTRLVIGLMFMNFMFITAQPNMEIRNNKPNSLSTIQKYFVADGLVSPNWKIGQRFIYDILNEGQIILIDLAKFKSMPQRKNPNLDRLPEDLPSKMLLLSDKVPKEGVNHMAFDAAITKTVDSLYGGSNKQFVVIFPNKQLKYINVSDISQIPVLGKDKMKVVIRYETYIKHIKCTNVNDASITIRALEGAEPYSFKWRSGQTTDKIDNLESGEYVCTITDALGNQSITKPITINVAPKLTVNISQKPLLEGSAIDVKTAHSGGIAPFQYRWLRDSTSISSEKDVANLSTGFYKLQIKDGLGCQYEYPLVIGESVDFKSKGLTYSANLYPNPSSGKTTLSLNDPLYNSDVDIIDAIGRTVYQINVKSNLATLELNALSEGIYTVKISNKLGAIYKKLIIKK